MSQGTTVAWFHCFSGIAGDMALGSLIDAGAPLDEVRALCDRLPVDGWAIEVEPVLRGGVAATRARVRAETSTVVRTAGHVKALIDEARLPVRVRDRSQRAFEALAEANSRLHRRPVSQVHFHDSGSVETIIEIVATCAALESLDVDEVCASTVVLGSGMTRGPHGGLEPVPSPATIELLRTAPTQGVDVPFALTTATGAAVLAATVVGWGPMPSMRIQASGFGAGARDIDGRANVTQVVLGTRAAQQEPGQPVTLLEANLDDATGEVLAHAVSSMLDAGAFDAWLTPIIMRRGHPAHKLSALVDSALAAQVAEVMRAETGSPNIRGHRLERWPSARHADEVDVEGRSVRVQVSAGRLKVEHDDAARAARHIGIPVREVVSLAEEAWRRRERGELTEVTMLAGVSDSEGSGNGGTQPSSGDDPDGPEIA
jgi:uncharacterized protein (TIGR00299 family) protein